MYTISRSHTSASTASFPYYPASTRHLVRFGAGFQGFPAVCDPAHSGDTAILVEVSQDTSSVALPCRALYTDGSYFVVSQRLAGCYGNYQCANSSENVRHFADIHIRS